MRRILFPLLVIGLAAGLFTLGSGAFFSDTESDTGNTITAGTLDLVAGYTGTTSCSVAAFVPTGADVDFDGPAEKCVSVVQNNGSITGDLYVRIDILDYENVCTEPETGDSTCGVGADQGELSSQLTVVSCTTTASVGSVSGSEPCVSTTTLTSYAIACTKVVDDWTAAATATFQFDLTDGTTNLSQSDSTTINFYFALVQVDQAPPAGCGGP